MIKKQLYLLFTRRVCGGAVQADVLIGPTGELAENRREFVKSFFYIYFLNISKMKSLVFILLLSIVFFQVVSSSDQESDDDFAEIDNDFDEFDFDDTADDSSKIKQEKNPEHSEPITDFDDEEEDEEFETKPSNFEDIEDAVVEDVDSESKI